MDCVSCGNCGAYFRSLVRVWYPVDRSPRRSHEEVVLERERRARAVVHRREFFSRRKKEKIDQANKIVYTGISEIGGSNGL